MPIKYQSIILAIDQTIIQESYVILFFLTSS